MRPTLRFAPASLLVLALVALAAGCSSAPDASIPGTCSSDHDCSSDEHCESAPSDCPDCISVCASGARCQTDHDCGAGSHCGRVDQGCGDYEACDPPNTICGSGQYGSYYCWPPANGDAPLCIPAASDAICRALGPALDFGGTSGCEPQNHCASADDCRAGERCIDAQCRADPGCVADADCGAGRACVRGECLVRCDAGEPCPDVTTCTVGACQWLSAPDTTLCPAGQLFYADRCHVVCNADRDCPLGFDCDAGLCALDTRPASARPAPACTLDADCAGGSRCVAGGCRAACPGGTDAECQRADVSLTRCDAQGICRP